MNNTDLDLLARHVHEAPEVTIEGAWVGQSRNRPIWFSKTGDSSSYPISEIIAERDRLTGKPTEWVNDWARWRAQDGNGRWHEFSHRPYITDKHNAWFQAKEIPVSVSKFKMISHGEVLGDWRDTLEDRVMSDWEPGLNPKQERSVPEWDGEGLPPLGTQLDGAKAFNQLGISEWWNKPRWIVVGHHFNGTTFFVEGIKSSVIQVFHIGKDAALYRPIRTERERVIEKMGEVIGDIEEVPTWTDALEALYDAFDIKMKSEGE